MTLIDKHNIALNFMLRKQIFPCEKTVCKHHLQTFYSWGIINKAKYRNNTLKGQNENPKRNRRKLRFAPRKKNLFFLPFLFYLLFFGMIQLFPLFSQKEDTLSSFKFQQNQMLSLPRKRTKNLCLSFAPFNLPTSL